MRNDFLTPRGTPYKWQELTASVERTVIGGGGPTVVPVRYEWQRVDAQIGSPAGAEQRREWTFARGQSFTSLLLHAELDGLPVPAPNFDLPPRSTMDIAYPGLPKSPAVDLLLMMSWDVVTFEMMATHLTTTPELREVGGRTNLERISGTWAELRFSDPRATAVFKNARGTARHLGHGCFGGRPTVIYTSTCLDCALDVRSGPVRRARPLVVLGDAAGRRRERGPAVGRDDRDDRRHADRAGAKREFRSASDGPCGCGPGWTRADWIRLSLSPLRRASVLTPR